MQQALVSSSASSGTTAPNNMGKRYADTVSIGNLNPSISSTTNAWTTVASKTSNRITTTTPPNILNSIVNQSAKPAEVLKSGTRTTANTGIPKPMTNIDEFIQMLLTFPLDPPPETIEIIQDSIYATSPTLDGRRFADEFIKRRKADANGLPMSSLLSHHSDSKLNKDLTNGSNSAKDDYTGNGAGAFKVVTTKK
ncbi:16653_t:CDS:2, partial [Racocetra fulgida]